MQSTSNSREVETKLEFSRQIFEKPNFMKIRPVGAVLLHAEKQTEGRTDGRTDRQRDRHDEANSRFSKFLRTGLKNTVSSSPKRKWLTLFKETAFLFVKNRKKDENILWTKRRDL